MPTTRSGVHYGPGTPTAKRTLSRKRKTVVKTYPKVKPTTIPVLQTNRDAGKPVKKVAHAKKPQTRTTKPAQKISQIQATKRKELVDKRRAAKGGHRIQPDGADYPDAGTSKLIGDFSEIKPGLIFIRQQLNSQHNPVDDLFKLEVEDSDKTVQLIAECGFFYLKVVDCTHVCVAYKNEAKSAVLNALDEYRKPNSKEGWFDVPKEKWDSFFALYNKTLKDHKAKENKYVLAKFNPIPVPVM